MAASRASVSSGRITPAGKARAASASGRSMCTSAFASPRKDWSRKYEAASSSSCASGRGGIAQARQGRAQEHDEFVEQRFGARRVGGVQALHGVEHVEEHLRVDPRLHRPQLRFNEPAARGALFALQLLQPSRSLLASGLAFMLVDEERRDQQRAEQRRPDAGAGRLHRLRDGSTGRRPEGSSGRIRRRCPAAPCR